MKPVSGLVQMISKPIVQGGIIAILILVFTVVDTLLPHDNALFEAGSGPWIVSTAMMLSFIILNSLLAIRIESALTYWSRSVMVFLALLALSYGWCFLLTGKHIDEAGSFRWMWFVLTLVYMVFFAIARSIKNISDIADRQEKELRQGRK